MTTPGVEGTSRHSPARETQLLAGCAPYGMDRSGHVHAQQIVTLIRLL